MNSYAKFGGAARRHFSAICEKPMGGHICAPPGRARVRCHHPINHVFDLYRYPPVPATARGTCRGEGVGDTLSIGNSTMAGPIAFKFGVCLETS